MKRKLRIFAGIALAFFAQQGESQASKDEIVVIVNKANPVKSMNRDSLRPIFQTTKTQWPDGGRIAAYELQDTDTTRHGFDAAVLGLDPDRVARYWVDRKIRGGERPPTKVANAAAMLRAVAANTAAIGYVKVDDANATVKVVARVRGGNVVDP